MTGASFERIDYQLRNNKHIERRLIFDRLSRAIGLIDYSAYRYLGFGSMWFVDFRLAHRVLGMTDLLSMEREEHADRANFNRPFRCIQVVPGESGSTIKGLPATDWRRPIVSWLDYDGSLDEGVVNDIGTLLDRSAIGSVVAVSVNANFLNYRPRNVSGPRKRADTALGQVEAILGSGTVAARFDKSVPSTGSHSDIGKDEFPEFLAVALLSWMVHRVASATRKASEAGGGSGLVKFQPIFNFCHKDGVDMVTVGGALVDADCLELWRDKVGEGIEWSSLDPGLPAHERIDLIPLTVKEKIILDTCLPEDRVKFLVDAKTQGLVMTEEQMAKYWRYYRQFPLFFETSA